MAAKENTPTAAQNTNQDLLVTGNLRIRRRKGQVPISAHAVGDRDISHGHIVLGIG